MFEVFRKLFRPKTDPSIIIDDIGVTRLLNDGSEEKVSWADLTRVSVITTDEGPAVEDAFILLWAGERSGCVIPFSSPAVQILLSRFRSLPGFNYEAFIAASSSTDNAEFVCWLKERDAS